MPYKNREDKLAWSRRYRLENPEKVRQQHKQWRVKNHDKLKAIYDKQNALRSPRELVFKGKQIVLKNKPRTGFCSVCKTHGRTNIHHIQYHDDDPLKDTIELCPSCHMKEHWRLGSFG